MNTRRYSYFPGCSLEGANRAYDRSARKVAHRLGLELLELEDWNCCGATAYMALNEKKSFVLSARNLALAEAAGFDLVTLCSGCYLVLFKANRYLQENKQLREDVRAALAAGGMDLQGSVKVRHFLEVLVNDLGEEEISSAVKQGLAGFKPACYYGCQISRPFGEIDDPEFPQSMDRLMTWLGASPVPFNHRARCCGGMLMTTRPDMGRRLSGNILRGALESGADCLVTACPLCQMNLEGYQRSISRQAGVDCHIPVVYFTQLLGAALGLEREDLALSDSLTPAAKVLARKGVLV